MNPLESAQNNHLKKKGRRFDKRQGSLRKTSNDPDRGLDRNQVELIEERARNEQPELPLTVMRIANEDVSPRSCQDDFGLGRENL